MSKLLESLTVSLVALLKASTTDSKPVHKRRKLKAHQEFGLSKDLCEAGYSSEFHNQ